MTDNEINIAIAEQCGYRVQVRDYTTDLNACHEMFNSLDALAQANFCNELAKMISGLGIDQCHEFHPKYVNATASQRCEAFLRTVGKWREGL